MKVRDNSLRLVSVQVVFVWTSGYLVEFEGIYYKVGIFIFKLLNDVVRSDGNEEESMNEDLDSPLKKLSVKEEVKEDDDDDDQEGYINDGIDLPEKVHMLWSNG